MMMVILTLFCRSKRRAKMTDRIIMQEAIGRINMARELLRNVKPSSFEGERNYGVLMDMLLNAERTAETLRAELKGESKWKQRK